MKKSLPIPVAVPIFVVMLGLASWLGVSNFHLKSNLAARDLAVANAKHENSELSDALTNAQTSLTDLENQIGGLTSTVGTLVKLKNTDPELLQKYSKVYFLSDNYVPKGLADIDPKYLLDQSRKLQFLSKAEPKLYSLIDDANASGLGLYVASAYRSFEMQNDLKSQYKVVYGQGTANSFSADQGYSEHQLGTAVDFTTKKIGGGLTGFDKTPEYAWLLANAYKYGFALSYPKNNAYYVFEPWHWRFVGVSLATRLHEENQYFIDLEQRQIDPYLINIFD